jgi:hypothetical protein
MFVSFFGQKPTTQSLLASSPTPHHFMDITLYHYTAFVQRFQRGAQPLISFSSPIQIPIDPAQQRKHPCRALGNSFTIADTFEYPKHVFGPCQNRIDKPILRHGKQSLKIWLLPFVIFARPEHDISSV